MRPMNPVIEDQEAFPFSFLPHLEFYFHKSNQSEFYFSFFIAWARRKYLLTLIYLSNLFINSLSIFLFINLFTESPVYTEFWAQNY